MSDILWIDNTGNVAVWFMNGATISSSAGLWGPSLQGNLEPIRRASDGSLGNRP
jgi:hypothetical protein